MAGLLILDTNVLSALMTQEPLVMAWARGFPTAQHFTTTITRAEILFGVELLPSGRRKEAMRALAREALAAFQSRLLPFGAEAADEYARIAAWRRRHGKVVATADVQIAAIAAVHRGAVATRNVRDFANSGIEVIDPWASGSS